MVPAAVEILGVTPGEHTVTVDMNEAFLAGSGSGLLGDFTMLNQMISTASAFGEIESVLFTVNGEPVTAFGSEGLDLSEPQGRDAYLDQLNSVNVDSPIQGQGDESLRVAGFANVFEATVSLEVVDATGNVVQEDFTTATCGTGCWGAYEFEVDYPFVGDETIRVFWHSAGGRVSQRCGLDPGPLGRPGRVGLHVSPWYALRRCVLPAAPRARPCTSPNTTNSRSRPPWFRLDPVGRRPT